MSNIELAKKILQITRHGYYEDQVAKIAALLDDVFSSTAKPNVELPKGVKLCDCPECGAEIQYGLAQDVIDKFNKVFGTKGAKPNVSG